MDKIKRRKWNIGSQVEIYSNSKSKWVKGDIINIINDNEGEWLQVKYLGTKTKQIQRYNKFIRPIGNKQNKYKPQQNPSPTPSSEYICRRCKKQGDHWRSNCPLAKQQNYSKKLILHSNIKQHQQWRILLIYGYILIMSNDKIRDKFINIDVIISDYLYDTLNQKFFDYWSKSSYRSDWNDDASWGYSLDIKRDLTYCLHWIDCEYCRDDFEYKLEGKCRIMASLV